MNYKSKGKDIRIVNLRALAILLVVFGHSVILYQNGWGYIRQMLMSRHLIC